MELYLAGVNTEQDRKMMQEMGALFLLMTFYDMKKWSYEKASLYIQTAKKQFILDSGAFTFMNSGKKVNWKKYVDEYISFINEHKIKYFIELDLYGVLGVETTEKIRKYIEYHTGRKPIPVYHGTMPVSYFRKLCQEYPYVAISATATLESSRWTRNTKALKQMIKIGHSYGTKLHGLGYTRLSNINKPEVMFDSVDSTSWLSGARFGRVYEYKHGNIVFKDIKNIDSTRMKLNESNLNIWIDKQKDLYYNH